ncbi:hypothetical protein [Streptomyces sp. NPDC049879]|uniref:hypothetical protein n=1 Tax=Streptomyces sp. NPDC049879 TaxID=3365598 RepID=UPI0037B8A580
MKGGPAAWRRATDRYAKLGWEHRELDTRRKRVVRRALGRPDASDVWPHEVTVPVHGSPWRAEVEAQWTLRDAARTGGFVLDQHWAEREDNHQVILPSWRVHTAGHAWATAGKVRRSLYACAVRLGLYDLRPRVDGSRATARTLARDLMPGAPRTNVDVRPLDGRGKAGVPPLREDAVKRFVALFIGPLLVVVALLVLARDATPAGRAVLGSAAAACAVVSCWAAVTLPLVRPRSGTLFLWAVGTGAAVVTALGVPGHLEAMPRAQTLACVALAYYVAGLLVLVRRWNWQLLAASVLPIVTTVVVAALPITGRLLHDAYADELSLTPAETSVNGAWQLAAAIRLLWPMMGAVLFVAAGWGLLRYFHLAQADRISTAALLALAVVVALVRAGVWTIDSPAEAAERLERAAAEGSAPPPYFGVRPEWTCAVPLVPTGELNEEGGQLDADRPYIFFGVAEGRAVIWNVDTGKPLRVPVSQVRLLSRENGRGSCT